MTPIFIFGWMLLALGVLAAGIEAAAHVMTPLNGWFIGAGPLWYELHPESISHLLAWTNVNLGDGAEGALRFLLVFPAWLLLGLPAMIIIRFAHPGSDEDVREVEESLGTYDRLAAEARRINREDLDRPQADWELNRDEAESIDESMSLFDRLAREARQNKAGQLGKFEAEWQVEQQEIEDMDDQLAAFDRIAQADKDAPDEPEDEPPEDTDKKA